MIIITLDQLNDIGCIKLTIDTGYCTYIHTNELWVQGKYNGYDIEYYVSSLGRIYNINTNKYSKLLKNDSGYLYCHSYYRGYRGTILINRLVAESFLGNPPKNIKRPEADHINSIKTDNSLSNIQWLSQKDNLAKRKLSNQSEDSNSNSKYSKYMIINIANDLASGDYSMNDIIIKYNIPKTTVSNIKNKYRWKKLLEPYDFSNVPVSKSKRSIYTTKQIIDVAELIIKNCPISEIVKITNVKYDMVLLIIKKKIYKNILEPYDFSSYKISRNMFNDTEKNNINELTNAGYTPKEICEILGITYTKKVRNAIYEVQRS